MLREHRAKEETAAAAASPAAEPAPGEPATEVPTQETPAAAAAPVAEVPAVPAGEAVPTTPAPAPAETPVATTETPATPSPAPATEAGIAAPASQPAGVSDASPASDLVKDTLDRAKEAAGTTSAPSAPAEAVTPEPASVQAPVQEPATSAPSAEVPASTPAPTTLVDTPEGQVNPATGEIVTPAPTHEEAVETVVAALGGQVVSETIAVEAVQEPVSAPAPAASAAPASPGACPSGSDDNCGGVCREDDARTDKGVLDKSGAPLNFICTEPVGPNPDFIKLSYIKYRKHLCNIHYLDRKNG
jgi:hypothetical protein